MLTHDTERALRAATSPRADPEPTAPRTSARFDDESPEQPLLRDLLPDDESLGERDLNLERLLLDDNEAPTALNITLVNVPYRADKAGFDGAVLDAFFRDKQVEAAREYFYVVDGRPHLSCWIEWTAPAVDPSSRTDTSAPNQKRRSGGPARHGAKVDEDHEFAAVMDETQQRVFDGLRAWRLTRARELGAPAYRVLTNRVMERIARANPADVEQLTAIPGVGPATVEMHGHAIVAVAAGCATPATRNPVGSVPSPSQQETPQQETPQQETPQQETPQQETARQESARQETMQQAPSPQERPLEERRLEERPPQEQLPPGA